MEEASVKVCVDSGFRDRVNRSRGLWELRYQACYHLRDL